MELVKKEDMVRIANLFERFHGTLVQSCLQGHMGKAWAICSDDGQQPISAQIIVGDFCFFAGAPRIELVRHHREICLLMVPGDSRWEALIEQEYQAAAKKFTRYGMKVDPQLFDREKLHVYVERVTPEYELRAIDEEIYRQLSAVRWSRDLCSQFSDFEDFHRRGIGIAALQDGVPVAGASSYTVFDEGIEIEIDTKKEYRRRGLALACASKLILECLDRGLFPGWDAHNKASVLLAEKLGYELDGEYTAYEVEVLRRPL